MAVDLVGDGAELPAVMVAGRWKSAAMVSRYAQGTAAGRGAVARYHRKQPARGQGSVILAGNPVFTHDMWVSNGYYNGDYGGSQYFGLNSRLFNRSKNLQHRSARENVDQEINTSGNGNQMIQARGNSTVTVLQASSETPDSSPLPRARRVHT